MSTHIHAHDVTVGEGHFACFMPATGEICGIGRTRDAAYAAAKATEHPSLGSTRDEIWYEVWPCSAALYDKICLWGGDISYDHLRGALVTEEEARRAAEAEGTAS